MWPNTPKGVIGRNSLGVPCYGIFPNGSGVLPATGEIVKEICRFDGVTITSAQRNSGWAGRRMEGIKALHRNGVLFFPLGIVV